MENIKVSIIIPSYNRGELLKEAVTSLLNQTHQNFEIIIVDDCSTDNTQEIVKRFSDPRIKYYKLDTNSGAPIARNVGIDKSKGDYVAFIDSDDSWKPFKLERQLAIFLTQPKVGAVYSGVEIKRDNKIIGTLVPEFSGNILPHLLTSNVINTTSSLIVKRELLTQINGFDVNLPSCQDWDLYIRLSEITEFGFVKEPLVIFLQHNGARISTNYTSVTKGHNLIYKKHNDKARGISMKLYYQLNYNIGKIVFRVGISSENKQTINLGREFIKESMKHKITFLKGSILYTLTYMNIKLLSMMYTLFVRVKNVRMI